MTDPGDNINGLGDEWEATRSSTKQAQSTLIEQQIADFKSKGGKVKEIETGHSNYRKDINEPKNEYKKRKITN